MANTSAALSKPVLHRDGLGRTWDGPDVDQTYLLHGPLENAFLRPDDGRLAFFTAQRIPKSKVSKVLRIVYWMFSDTNPTTTAAESVDLPGLTTQRIMKWFPGSLAIFCLMCYPTNIEGEMRNGGSYDPVRYREWLYARSPRNTAESPNLDDMSEDPSLENVAVVQHRPDDLEAGHVVDTDNVYQRKKHQALVTSSAVKSDDVVLLQREQGPKKLCFIQDSLDGTPNYRCKNVKDWMHENQTETEPKYVFLSFTRKQFCVSTAAEIAKWDVPEDRKNILINMSRQDRQTLTDFGCQIARAAGFPAFWVDYECLKPDTAEEADDDDTITDVYRICDIVRLASSLVILRGPPIDEREAPITGSAKAQWLKQWGTRLWTVPEALLCPSEVIEIYTSGEGLHPELVEKRRLAASAWADADKMRDLIDHYESSLSLTPLELVSIALEGLQWRKTDQRKPGDASYALMGLLRRRPLVVKSDSDFEAFARLSLANDSDMLLERLLCMQPATYQSPWHRIEDAWNAHLWDIQPHCQVAGIVDNRTVTLDGAFAANIHWTSLEQVAVMKRSTVLTTAAKLLIRFTPLYFLIAMIMLGTGASTSNTINSIYSKYGEHSKKVVEPTEIAGIVLFIITFALTMNNPWLIYRLYSGKFWSTQAWFFGIEGIPDISEVERCLFGLKGERLKWSAFGSLLSRHALRNGECVGLRPATAAAPDGMKVYTLIDTFTMTATAFHAARPPCAVMVCGREGGMQRAVLCSYDWRSQTFCREAVLRMKTLALERMSRIDRFRFCLDRTSREKS